MDMHASNSIACVYSLELYQANVNLYKVNSLMMAKSFQYLFLIFCYLSSEASCDVSCVNLQIIILNI